MKIILASKSPRRKELLQLITPKFEIIVSDAEEKLEENLTPEEQATRISYTKAKTSKAPVNKHCHPNAHNA